MTVLLLQTVIPKSKLSKYYISSHWSLISSLPLAFLPLLIQITSYSAAQQIIFYPLRVRMKFVANQLIFYYLFRALWKGLVISTRVLKEFLPSFLIFLRTCQGYSTSASRIGCIPELELNLLIFNLKFLSSVFLYSY